MREDGELLFAYAREGDVKALSELVVRHGVWMRAFLRSLLPGEADADDAFQDAWMKVIRSAPSYRGGKVKSFLVAVARSAAIDRLRRGGRTVSLDAGCGTPAAAGVETGGALADEIVDEGSPDPGERFESGATAAEVRRAVRSLAWGPRQVLLMRIEGELAFKEIAAQLDVPLGTALTWMRTATLKLKEMLGGK